MFDHYTQEARRVIFWALKEAQGAGSDYIEPEHLFLGIVREINLSRFISDGTGPDIVRREVEGLIPAREAKPSREDMPLSGPSKRVLAYGSEEAERLKCRSIGPDHLLLGLLREPSEVSRILEKHGVRLEEVQQRILDSARRTGL